jgi:tRNA-modifying protein YgfZ
MELTDDLYADRSGRGKLEVSGPQRAWFLDQILTQRFEDMQPGEARDAAMITVHGRMTAFLETVATDRAILCHFEPELRPELIDALRRYVFATQVELTDVTEAWGLVLVAGPTWGEAVAAAPVEPIVHPTSELGASAAYLWVQPSSMEALVASLRTNGLRDASEEELETLRIAAGMPRWGREMTAKTFPQEVGIDGRAVHYDKGCYLGQEAMAKIHFRGKVNRRLAVVVAAERLEPGAEIAAEGKRVGVVTSASDGRGLALVHHTIAPGASVGVGDVEARVIG